MAQPHRALTDKPQSLYLAHDRSDDRKVKSRGRHRGTLFLSILALIFVATFALLFHPVSLHWNASATRNPELVYEVYRAPGTCSANADPKMIGSTTALNFWDTSIKFGTFCYSVRARVGADVSPNSNLAEVQIRPTFKHW